MAGTNEPIDARSLLPHLVAGSFKKKTSCFIHNFAYDYGVIQPGNPLLFIHISVYMTADEPIASQIVSYLSQRAPQLHAPYGNKCCES